MPLCVINITPPMDEVTPVSQKDYLRAKYCARSACKSSHDGMPPSLASTATCTDASSNSMLDKYSMPSASSEMAIVPEGKANASSSLLVKFGRRLEEIIDNSPIGVKVEPGSLARPSPPTLPHNVRPQNELERIKSKNARSSNSATSRMQRTPMHEIEVKTRAGGKKPVVRKTTKEIAGSKKNHESGVPRRSICTYQRDSGAVELVYWEHPEITDVGKKKKGSRLFNRATKKYEV